MSEVLASPPFDPEIDAVLTALAEAGVGALTPDQLAPENIAVLRSFAMETVDSVLADQPVTHQEHTIAGHNGDDIIISVFTPTGHTGTGPGIFNIHGGGMVMGDRFLGSSQLVQWVLDNDAVGVSVEYRLAPEFPDPYPVEDCYAALLWTTEHAAELGIDADRILVAGGSAGGGLAAGVTLLARDRQGPKLLGQLLMCPMLDDRNETISSRQYEGVGVWDRTSNITGWSALLGERSGTDDVSDYAAPARAQDLSGLPATYIDAGSAEVFRDEDVAYASRIWAAGGNAELHIWAGGTHGFEGFAPHAAISVAAQATRGGWVARLFRA